MPELRIHLADAAGGPPLYHRYPGEYRPQSAYVELDLESGDLSAGWNDQLGNAVPPRVLHRCALRWSVPIYLSGGEVNALLGEIAPAARRLLDGAEVIWDGNAYVGHLSDEADTAEGEIDDLCSRAEGSVVVCTPEEWLGAVPAGGLLEEGETVVHAATRIQTLAWNGSGTHIDGDLVSYLTERISAELT